MLIKVGDRDVEVPEGTDVEKLIELENVEMPLYVTVCVNDDLIQPESRKTRVLAAGDHVEFLYFMGGGC